MIARVLYLLVALMIFVYLCTAVACHISGINLFQKYKKQIALVLWIFVFLIVMFYVMSALIGLR